MVVRTGITCRHQIQQNKNTEHSIHELKCIAMCLPPSGRWEQGDLEQLLGGWEQAEADGNRESRSSRSGRWPPPRRRGWLEGRGAGHHLQAPPRWDGMARSRLPARGCGGDVVWPMAAGRRPGDGGGRLVKNRGILVFQI